MPKERQGAAHKITASRTQNQAEHHQSTQAKWKPRAGSNMQGNVVSGRYAGEEPYEHRLEVTQGRKSPGFSAGVDYVNYVGGHGTESSQLRAGPFRTQRRAEIAGDALLNRAEAGKQVEDYQIGEYHESIDEIRANRAGLL